MPVVRRADAPTFTTPNGRSTFHGLASPSRGSAENSCWDLVVDPDQPAGVEHSVDHEELFVVIAGQLVVSIDGELHDAGPGDCVIVPAHTQLSVGNPFPEPARAIVVLPAGAKARIADGEPFLPPWSV